MKRKTTKEIPAESFREPAADNAIANMNEIAEMKKFIVYNMKRTLNTCIRCCAVCCGVFLIIHRRVIAAFLTGVEMPEMPEWHRKCFKYCCKER